jgi:hypothetical protein
MLNKILKLSFVSALITSPIFVFAQAGLGLPIGGGQPLGGTTTFFENALGLIQGVLIPLVFTLALLAFFWGVVKYIWGGVEDKAKGRDFMIWGIVALFVMASVWGLVRFIQGEFNINNNSNMTIPTVNVGS